MALFSAQLAALFPKASPKTLSRPFRRAQRSACLGVFQWMHKNKVTCAQDASDSCRYSVLIRNGGPGQVRTGDLEFRKPLSLVLGCSRNYCLSRLKSWSSRTFSKDQRTSLRVHCSKNVVVF